MEKLSWLPAKSGSSHPPSKKELTDGSKQLKKGHSSGARTMADKSVANRQGAKRPKGK
jgi:hypothetical protein